MQKNQQLASGTLGLAESIIMGIAGTAPAFSIEVTASTLILATGILSPGCIFYTGLIMFGIAFAYINLNKMNPHAGAAFSWVGDIFGQTLGFFAGWCLVVASCLFMVSGTIPAANAFLLVFAPEKMNDVHLITVIASILLSVISLIVMKGVKLTSIVQIFMTGLEMLILAVIAVASFIIFPHISAHAFSLKWFSLMAFSPKEFADGALIAMFFYWGWDVVMNLNEETKDPAITAGRGVFWAMTFLLFFFVIFMVIILMGLSDVEIQHYNTNVIYAVADKLYGRTFALLAIIAVLLSTVGTLETSILQFSRTLFAKGRAGALHPRYAKVHEKWKTPYVAVLFIWAIGMGLLLLSSYIPTVNEILKAFIHAIGFQIAFYLGLASYACAWYYRKMMTSSNLLNALTHVFWPAFSGTFLFFIVIYSVPTFDWLTLSLGLGGIVFGIVPYTANRYRNRKIQAQN